MKGDNDSYVIENSVGHEVRKNPLNAARSHPILGITKLNKRDREPASCKSGLWCSRVNGRSAGDTTLAVSCMMSESGEGSFRSLRPEPANLACELREN